MDSDLPLQTWGAEMADLKDGVAGGCASAAPAMAAGTRLISTEELDALFNMFDASVQETVRQ